MQKKSARRFTPSATWLMRWIVPAALALTGAIIQWRVPSWMERVESWLVDARFELRGKELPRSPILIVALDEDSFQVLGDLQGENIRTWPRTRWAELIAKISAGNPRLIVMDVVFDMPGWDEGGDQLLADVIAQSGNVVLASNLDSTSYASSFTTTYSPPILSLQEVAAATGVATLVPDADGGIRRAQLLTPLDQQILPSLALVVANLYAGEPPSVPREDLDEKASLPIHYRGPEGTFQTISMIDVWNGDVAPDTFRDAIVLVGYTTQLEQDRHLAPFAGNRKMPGVEIQANIVDTLLAGDWLHRPPAWLSVLLILILSGLGIFLVNLPRPVMGISLFLAGVFAYLIIGALLFASADFLLPLAVPVIVSFAVAGAALTGRMVFAEQDKRNLRQRLAGVMSPERLQAVMDNWESLLQTERPRKEVAVLFSDVRGFTNASETLLVQNRSAEMVKFLSAYLDVMEDAVFNEGGVIFDVVGDGLMILFGLPESFPDFAMRAVRAAVRMSLATRELQELWPLKNERPLRLGIGLHCGSVVDAVVGRGRRINYQVIGDPVNTTARIESHCKVAMGIPRPPGGQVPETVTILISRKLFEQVRDHVLADESIPAFEARGKSEPLQVVRLLGLRNGEEL